MPDPVTIMMASFAAVKAGVAGAKSLHELGKDMGSLFSFRYGKVHSPKTS